jgi:hypothetical protein
MPGAIVITRMPWRANSRAIGNVMAATPLRHHLRRQTDGVEGSHQVDLDDPREGLQGVRSFPAEHLLRRRYAGAVNRAVQSAEALQRGVDSVLNAFLVGDVGLHEADVVTRGLTFEVGYHDVRPFVGENVGGGGAEAGAGTGHEESATPYLHQACPGILDLFI